MNEQSNAANPAPVDLRTCKPGDRLLSRHGMILTYVKPLPHDAYMEHEVRYPDGSKGTRTNDGFVFRTKRLLEDHDIIRILQDAEEIETDAYQPAH